MLQSKLKHELASFTYVFFQYHRFGLQHTKADSFFKTNSTIGSEDISANHRSEF